MAVQHVDTADNAADVDIITGSGGTVTNVVRVIYNDTDSPDKVVAALKRAMDFISVNL
jgi:hypothetical protein